MQRESLQPLQNNDEDIDLLMSIVWKLRAFKKHMKIKEILDNLALGVGNIGWLHDQLTLLNNNARGRSQDRQGVSYSPGFFDMIQDSLKKLANFNSSNINNPVSGHPATTEDRESKESQSSEKPAESWHAAMVASKAVKINLGLRILFYGIGIALTAYFAWPLFAIMVGHAVIVAGVATGATTGAGIFGVIGAAAIANCGGAVVCALLGIPLANKISKPLAKRCHPQAKTKKHAEPAKGLTGQEESAQQSTASDGTTKGLLQGPLSVATSTLAPSAPSRSLLLEPVDTFPLPSAPTPSTSSTGLLSASKKSYGALETVERDIFAPVPR